jgi:hypothetical protein
MPIPTTQIKKIDDKKNIQQGLRKHRGFLVFGSSELLEISPNQNFDNEKSKVNYKDIWFG